MEPDVSRPYIAIGQEAMDTSCSMGNFTYMLEKKYFHCESGQILEQMPMDDMLSIVGVIQTTGLALNNLTCLL